MSVRFVYFDLGKVLLLFSVSRLLYQVAELTGAGENEIAEIIFGKGKYMALESGEISGQEYFDQICIDFDRRLDADQFLEATNNIFWVNESILPVIRHLSRKLYPRGILSNTGPYHWHYVQTSFPFIRELFPRHRVASFSAKSIKPNRKIYEEAFAEAKTELPDLLPEEILLIDDLEENIQGARDFGFQGIVYTNTETLITEMKKFGLPVPSEKHE
ncbi:MAG: HAD family phosphatase [Planctomycetia bacterium]|nr:HAD family phosphatase [Planctomycetia bacterium]